jgi:hypothetical protein
MIWTFFSLVPTTLFAQERNQIFQNPAGDLHFGKIDGGGVYRFSGVARNVTIEEINGRTTVDMWSLSAESITIGLLDGASCVRFKVSGDFTITKKVDGRSWLAGKAGRNITIGDKVDGRSRAKLKAGGTLQIGDKVDGGPCTAVLYQASQTVIPHINGGSRVDQRAISDDEVCNLRTYPFDFRCTIDDSNYPTPPMPD